jgi:SAM-dependent methyltransferase
MPLESKDVSVPPELELVLLCLRNGRDPSVESPVRALLAGPFDWDELAAIVVSHQVLPYFYRRLQEIAPDCAPPYLRLYFEARTRHFAKNNMLLFAEMLRLISAFEGEQILLIPYKGIVQSWLAYRDVGVRPCQDLDFALRQRDVNRAVELLQAHGYKFHLLPEELRRAEGGQFPGQYAFDRGNAEFMVELHTEMTLRYFPVALDFDALERRLQTVEIGGRPVRTLSPEDTILFLCVHGAKHFWARLNWIVDVARLSAAEPQPDWTRLEATAAAMRCTRSVLLGLLLANKMLGAQIPDGILRRAFRDRSVVCVAQEVREQMARREECPRGIFRRARFRLRTRDRARDGLFHIWRLTTRPTEHDWGYAAGVAGRSLISSALLRPWRLLRRYGWRLAPEPQRDLAIFEPTSAADVDRMIDLAEVGPDDLVYDLGCGDGRVLIRAAQRCGSRGVGVDVDPRRIAESRANARSAGLEDRVRFILHDAKTSDLTGATVVFLFLGVAGNLRLVQNLQKQLRPGTRVISRGYSIPGWEAETVDAPPSGGDRSTRILYRFRTGGAQTGASAPQAEPAAHMNRIAAAK